MPKIQYIIKRFNSKSVELIELAGEIIETFVAEGYSLTLRQLYYQLVAKAVIENTVQSIQNRLGSLINDARKAGLIDWEAIEDRTRELCARPHWEQPSEIVESAAEDYSIDLWSDQAKRVEVWIEKDALVGVIEDTCTKLDAPFFSCRGYISQSEMWRAGMRMRHGVKKGQVPIVIHLGDHDPSGIDMTRDIQDRLTMFVGKPVKVIRAALNMNQIDQYQPPPNPAKTTDSRYAAYIELYGRESWELDALSPQVINAIVRKHVKQHMSKKKWEAREAVQEERRATLTRISESYEDVVEYLGE